MGRTKRKATFSNCYKAAASQLDKPAAVMKMTRRTYLAAEHELGPQLHHLLPQLVELLAAHAVGRSEVLIIA